VQGLLADGPLDDYNTLWQAWEQDEDIKNMLPKYQAMAKKSAGTPELPMMGEGCDVCSDEPEADEQESHKYEKHHSTNTGSVSVEASAETIDELKVLLRKVGITLPGGEPEAEEICSDCGKPGSECDCPGHDHSEEPMQIVKVDVDDEKPQVNPYNSGQPDKQVLTNIIRDKLKDYLRNSQS
jgi:hypothetical protein